MKQISKVINKSYQMDFEWILENVWSFQWVGDEFIESKILNFAEAKVSS